MTITKKAWALKKAGVIRRNNSTLGWIPLVLRSREDARELCKEYVHVGHKPVRVQVTLTIEEI